jgi:hypothetical protein
MADDGFSKYGVDARDRKVLMGGQWVYIVMLNWPGTGIVDC